MKRMTYRKLMSLTEAGDAIICAYERNGDSIILETYDHEGRAKREEVEITHTPHFRELADRVEVEENGDVLYAKTNRR